MLHDLSYLAGLIDGEGHIGFHSRGVSKKTKRFVIDVKMTEEKIIDWLVSSYGGHKQFHPKQKAHWKDQWRWRLSDRDARALYVRLKPLLKIKNTVEFPPASKDDG